MQYSPALLCSTSGIATVPNADSLTHLCFYFPRDNKAPVAFLLPLYVFLILPQQHLPGSLSLPTACPGFQCFEWLQGFTSRGCCCFGWVWGGCGGCMAAVSSPSCRNTSLGRAHSKPLVWSCRHSWGVGDTALSVCLPLAHSSLSSFWYTEPSQQGLEGPCGSSASLPPRLIPDFICKHLFALAKNHCLLISLCRSII